MSVRFRRMFYATLCGALLATTAIAAEELSRDAQKELAASKSATLRCKKEIQKAVKKNFPNDASMQAQLYSKALGDIKDFCGKNWYSGCVVLQKTTGKCSFTETDKETRQERDKTKYFPKDFMK